MSTPIAEDFAAIRARMQDIRAAERPAPAAPEASTEAAPAAAAPQDFYFWLTGGHLWGGG